MNQSTNCCHKHVQLNDFEKKLVAEVSVGLVYDLWKLRIYFRKMGKFCQCFCTRCNVLVLIERNSWISEFRLGAVHSFHYHKSTLSTNFLPQTHSHINNAYLVV